MVIAVFPGALLPIKSPQEVGREKRFLLRSPVIAHIQGRAEGKTKLRKDLELELHVAENTVAAELIQLFVGRAIRIIGVA